MKHLEFMFKGYVLYTFTILFFLRLNESTFDTRKNVFYFTYIQILEYCNLKFHDVIKCLKIK